MRANILVFYQQQNLGQRFGQMHLKPDICSNAANQWLFIHCFVDAPNVCVFLC